MRIQDFWTILYLFEVFYQAEKAELKEIIKKKGLALILDELSNDEGRYVLDVMAVLLDFDELSLNGNSVAYLLDTHFLSATNNRTVHKYGIDYDDGCVFNSDNVAYVKKAFCDTILLIPFLRLHYLPQPHC